MTVRTSEVLQVRAFMHTRSLPILGWLNGESCGTNPCLYAALDHLGVSFVLQSMIKWRSGVSELPLFVHHLTSLSKARNCLDKKRGNIRHTLMDNGGDCYSSLIMMLCWCGNKLWRENEGYGNQMNDRGICILIAIVQQQQNRFESGLMESGIAQ